MSDLMIPKNLISSKIVRFEQDEILGTITMWAKSDLGDYFKVTFAEYTGDVQMNVENKTDTAKLSINRLKRGL